MGRGQEAALEDLPVDWALSVHIPEIRTSRPGLQIHLCFCSHLLNFLFHIHAVIDVNDVNALQ